MIRRLVDSSVWIDYLRGVDSSARYGLRAILSRDPNSAIMCEPIAMELLARATRSPELERIERLVNGLPTVAVDPALDFRAAASVFRATRQAGLGMRNVIERLVAAIVIRHDLVLVHKDADFASIAAVSPLKREDLRR